MKRMDKVPPEITTITGAMISALVDESGEAKYRPEHTLIAHAVLIAFLIDTLPDPKRATALRIVDDVIADMLTEHEPT